MDGTGAVYGEGRERLSQLVVHLSDDEAETPVPACPVWTVRDVVAHLAGSCADVVAGNLDGVTTAPWADAQVSQRRGRTMAELVGEWSAIAPGLEATADRFPPRMALLWVLDLTAHEHDVRGALGRPGAREITGARHRARASRRRGPALAAGRVVAGLVHRADTSGVVGRGGGIAGDRDGTRRRAGDARAGSCARGFVVRVVQGADGSPEQSADRPDGLERGPRPVPSRVRVRHVHDAADRPRGIAARRPIAIPDRSAETVGREPGDGA